MLLRAAGTAGSIPKPIFRTVTTTQQVIAQVPLAGAGDQKPQVLFDVRAEGSNASVFHQVGRIGTTTTGLMVAEAVVPAATLAPGHHTLTATIGPGGAPQFGRTFLVEPAPAPRVE